MRRLQPHCVHCRSNAWSYVGIKLCLFLLYVCVSIVCPTQAHWSIRDRGRRDLRPVRASFSRDNVDLQWNTSPVNNNNNNNCRTGGYDINTSTQLSHSFLCPKMIIPRKITILNTISDWSDIAKITGLYFYCHLSHCWGNFTWNLTQLFMLCLAENGVYGNL